MDGWIVGRMDLFIHLLLVVDPWSDVTEPTVLLYDLTDFNIYYSTSYMVLRHGTRQATD